MPPIHFNASNPQATGTVPPATAKSACVKPDAAPPATSDPLAALRAGSASVTTVSIRLESNSAGVKATGVNAYQAVEQVGSTPYGNNPYANTILSFIQLQLQRDIADGASPEALQSRLEAGLRGFEQGYGEAYAQLLAAGILGDDSLRADIEDTRHQVLSGIQKLAQQMGLDWDLNVPQRGDASGANPALAHAGVSQGGHPGLLDIGKSLLTQVARDAQIIERYVQSVKESAERSEVRKASATAVQGTSAKSPVRQYAAHQISDSRYFSLQLRTAEGDEVSIRIYDSKKGSSALGIDGASGQNSVWTQGERHSGLQFVVNGELSDSENQALSDLLNRISGVAEQFFAGNLDKAMTLAAELDFDRETIAGFSVDMTRVWTEAVAVQAPASAAGPDELDLDALVQQWDKSGALSLLQRFVEDLAQAANQTQALGQPRSLVADLLEWVAQNRYAEDPRSPYLAPLARQWL